MTDDLYQASDADSTLASKPVLNSHVVIGLRGRLVIAIVLVVLAVTLILLLVHNNYHLHKVQDEAVGTINTRLSALGVDFIKVIGQYDLDDAAELAGRLRGFPDINTVILHDNQGKAVFRYDSGKSAAPEFPDAVKTGSSAIMFGDTSFLLRRPVTHDNVTLGWITIWTDMSQIVTQYREHVVAMFTLLAVIGFAATVLALLVAWLITRPINRIRDFTLDIARHGDRQQRLAMQRSDEIGDLVVAFNAMLDQIAAARHEIDRLNESRLRNIINSSLDGFISINSNGKIVDWNPQAGMIFGWKAEEILGKSLTDTLIPVRYRKQHDEGMAHFLKTGERRLVDQRVELAGLHHDGHEFPVELSITPIRNDQGGWFFTTFVRDLTTQRNADQQVRDVQRKLLKKERLAAIGQVTATVAHELRNPMGTIRNTAYVLGRKYNDIEDPGVSATVDRLDRNIQRCDAIISELLEFTREQAINPEPVVLDLWLERLLDDYEIPASVRVARNLASGVMVSLDPVYFQSAVINLLDNAVQAADERQDGRGLVEVSTVAVNGRAGLLVLDNGRGITVEDRKNVFEPMFSTKTYGVGLGLAVVKKVMEKHGGEVVLENNPAGGARAALWLDHENRVATQGRREGSPLNKLDNRHGIVGACDRA